jgi:hypothetical protein
MRISFLIMRIFLRIVGIEGVEGIEESAGEEFDFVYL